MADDTQGEKTFNVLVFGAERFGIPPLHDLARSGRTRLTFAPFDTESKFSDYDGVVVFQGAFETFTTFNDWAGDERCSHSCKRDDLDRRVKEARLLVRKGGFVCFILTEAFVDQLNGEDLRSTDLTKLYSGFMHRSNFDGRVSHLDVHLSEFQRFFDLFGAASSWFDVRETTIAVTPVASVADRRVSVLAAGSVFFVPSLPPPREAARATEYFDLLIDAAVTVFSKFVDHAPEWAHGVQLSRDTSLRFELLALAKRRAEIEEDLARYEAFRLVLVAYGSQLVHASARILNEGFQFSLSDRDEGKEDLTILSKDGQPLVLVEVKGTNRGVKREHINQADSHRERRGFAENFPTVVLINTHIKHSTSIQDKDQEVAREQIRHAHKNGVLVLRTLDLIRLLGHVEAGKLTNQEALQLLQQTSGWLRVTEIGWEKREA